MKLVKKIEDKLTKKTVYELEMDYKGQKTPDRKSVLEMAAREINVDKNLMIIKKIDNVYGKESAKVIIHAYATKAEMEKNAPKHLIKRVTFKAEEKKEEVKA